MMAYYFKPPRGTLSYSKLSHGAMARLHFLIDLHGCHGNAAEARDVIEARVQDSEWLIEGSKKDHISHFFCRLACCESSEMREFFVAAETALFSYRVSCMRETELQHTVSKLHRFHNTLRTSGLLQGPVDFASYWSCGPLAFPALFLSLLTRSSRGHLSSEMCAMLEVMDHVTVTRGWSDLVSLYCAGADLTLHVPFQAVLHLVSMRKVPLHGGLAYLPVTRLCDLLVHVFHGWLVHAMAVAGTRWAEVSQDGRIRKLSYMLKYIFRRRFPHLHPSHVGVSCIASDDVDRLASVFPLCMAQLHAQLRSRHRLQHHARIAYSLFLKECGLPLNEALHFWRQEYSQPGRHGNCQHGWQKDERRYVYSIRHLYGLEGSRINYRGHSCLHIQGHTPVGDQEGGCPFAHFDAASLQAQLAAECIESSQQVELLELSSAGHYRQACAAFLMAKISQMNQQHREYSNLTEAQHSKCDAWSNHQQTLKHSDENRSKISVNFKQSHHRHASHSPTCKSKMAANIGVNGRCGQRLDGISHCSSSIIKQGNGACGKTIRYECNHVKHGVEFEGANMKDATFQEKNTQVFACSVKPEHRHRHDDLMDVDPWIKPETGAEKSPRVKSEGHVQNKCPADTKTEDRKWTCPAEVEIKQEKQDFDEATLMETEEICPCGTQHDANEIKPTNEKSVDKKHLVSAPTHITNMDIDKKEGIVKLETGLSRVKSLSGLPQINKPVDFYRSFQNLLNGLKC